MNYFLLLGREILNQGSSRQFLTKILPKKIKTQTQTSMILETVDLPYKKDNLPWVEKYRPKTLEGLISHNSIITTIKEFIKRDALPHLLFYGPPGTGKTSTMVACAKDMFGNHYRMSVLELNASDERGINTVRDLIKTFCETRSPFDTNKDSKKVIILDEADSMTKDAQNALRRIIEKYSRTCR
jgi:replication factor C subunit 3/5